MDPHDAFAQNQAKFNEDLADLINSAAAVASSNTPNSSSTVPTSPSSTSQPRTRKRAASQQGVSKRIRLEDDSPRHVNVHPSRLKLVVGQPAGVPAAKELSPQVNVHHSRLGLVMEQSTVTPHVRKASLRSPVGHSSGLQFRDEVPLLQRTGSNTVPLGKPIKRRATHASGMDVMARRDSAISGASPSRTATGSDCIGAVDKSTLSTLRNTVRRQWDSSNDLAYEQLLENRRTEQLDGKVDRYVPSSTFSKAHRTTAKPRSSSFPYSKLPKKVRAKVLALLLVDQDPIVIDFTWLRSFVNGHCRVPVVEKTIKGSDMTAYTIPMEWDQLVQDVKIMQQDCVPFKAALEDRGNKTRKRKAPCRRLTTGVLTVSKDMHTQASDVLYGQNTFRFPWGSSCWMQLESFLATIGPVNVGKLRKIAVHCPLWYRGIKEDFLEGAMLDLTSPASRLGVVQPPSRDRLLSAIAGSVEALLKAAELECFALEMEHGLTTERWAGSYHNTRRLIAMNEAEEHVTRKQEGVRLLKSLSESLPSLPVVSIHHQGKVAKHDLSEFRSRLASVIREAEKYGWKVDQRLHDQRW